MKTYECNNELASVFQKFGFTETTKEFDKLRNKREFRKGKTSRLVILFDRGNLMAFEGSRGCNVPDNPTAEDLKLFIWYINSNSPDRKLISEGHFDINSAKDCFNTLKSLSAGAEELEVNTPEIRKYNRILKNYAAISLD